MENNENFNSGVIIILIPILLKYHKEIFSFLVVITEILVELKNEIILYRKRQVEIHDAKLLKIELEKRRRCHEDANRESLRRIRLYIEQRKKEMSEAAEAKTVVVEHEEEKKLGKIIFNKIKNHKKLSMGIAGIILLIISLIPQLEHYAITIKYCDVVTEENTCEVVAEDLSVTISNLIGALTEEATQEPK